MNRTSIEWTERTWNPVRGCSRVSEGCRNCYAERQAARFRGGAFRGFVEITNGHPQWTGKVELMDHILDVPFKTRKPAMWFVNSMSDLFHESLSWRSISKVFAVMAQSPQHTFQILTKRPKIMQDYITNEDTPGMIEEAAGKGSGWLFRANIGRWPLPNVWLGVSCEDQETADERIPLLQNTPAAIRFVSAEPLLGPVSFRWSQWPGIDWVIVGGESGPYARSCDVAWIRSIRDQCKEAGIACFVKQLGRSPRDRNDAGFEGDGGGESWPMGTNYIDTGYQGAPVLVKLWDRKGGDLEEWPESLRIREFPK